MIEYAESPKSIEASAIPTLQAGGSYYDPVSETYVPGIKAKVDIEGLGIVEDAIVESIEQGFGSSANICSFLLPRSFDDYGQVDTNKTVECEVNNKLLFKGKIRSLYPAQTDRGEMVRVNASDKRVEMQETPFEKGGYRQTYNPRPTTITGKPGEWVDYLKIGYTSCRQILDDILAYCDIEKDEIAEAFSSFDPGEITFADMNCAEALDLLTQKAGNFRWWLTPEGKLIIHQIGTGNERVAYLGEEGELAGNFNVISAELSKSVSNLVKKVIFIGGKDEIETSTILIPDWDIYAQRDWNLDNKDEKEYRNVYRRYSIPEEKDLMSRLITFPYLGPIVYCPDLDKPWGVKVLEGYSIDYEEKKVIFSSPQYRIEDMETGEVEPIPIMMIYAKYGSQMKIIVENEELTSGDTRIMRDESYIRQSVLSEMIDFEMYWDAPKVSPRNDTSSATKLAQAELDRYSIPDIRGSIEMVGDETVDVAQRVSLLNALGEHSEEYANLKGSVVSLIHNLIKGYSISMNITNERPRMGMPERRIPPEVKYDLDKDRDEIQKTGELLPRKDAIPEGHHPHRHKKAEEDGLAYAVYHPEEEE